jgi:hypothetical protein
MFLELAVISRPFRACTKHAFRVGKKAILAEDAPVEQNGGASEDPPQIDPWIRLSPLLAGTAPR